MTLLWIILSKIFIGLFGCVFILASRIDKLLFEADHLKMALQQTDIKVEELQNKTRYL